MIIRQVVLFVFGVIVCYNIGSATAFRIASISTLSDARRSSSIIVKSNLTKRRRQEPNRIPSLLELQETSSSSAYEPQYEIQTVKKTKKLYPKVGDVVRFYDVDGGKANGQVMVGKIAFIQKQLNQDQAWMVELAELEDTGDGYFAEFPSRKRQSRKTMRRLEDVSPIAASFVRAENAYKIPRKASGLPDIRQEQYDIDGYEGPFSAPVDENILRQDLEIYKTLKSSLLRSVALAGIAGTVVVELAKGMQDAIIYFMGALAGFFYLFFLTVKTDTIASPDAKMGSSVSNLRFAGPLVVVLAVAFYNRSLGDANPVKGEGLFSYVTSEQFGALVVGFLTYRIPLFVSQLKEAFDGMAADGSLPGSVGVAIKLASDELDDQLGTRGQTVVDSDGLTPILVVSGPAAAGRTELVQRLIAEGEGRFVEPKRFDSVDDGAKFEQMVARGEFLTVDGRYGVTQEGITKATIGSPGSVVVVDADVSLVKKLIKIPNVRLIGVWVSLDSTEKFEQRLLTAFENGEIDVAEDETKESTIRARVKQIVSDIEFGILSGIFDFTILNDNADESMVELRQASEYAFK